MKKIISILAAGILFSCSNETETAQASADAAIIRLMKTPDKNSLTVTERKEILEHLEKNPQDIKYLMRQGNTKDPRTENQDRRLTAKTAEYTPGDYFNVRPFPSNSADFGASVEIRGTSGYKTLIYGWTMAYNLLGLFDIKSYENLTVADNGPLGAYNYSYQIVSAYHAGSGLTYTSAPVGWSETGRNVTYTANYFWFFTAGNLSMGTSSMPISQNKNGNINSIAYSNGVYSTGY